MVQMQKHIDALRREAISQARRADKEALDAKRTKRKYQWALVGAVAVILALGLSNINTTEHCRFLEKKLHAQDSLQQRFDNVVEDWHWQSKRVLELEQANEALMQYATPKSVTKAVQHTPLPKLVTL